jgi:hypothetical protein
MRKITILKTMLLAIVMMVGSGNAWGQLLVEDFSYTAGTDLTANNWAITGTTATPTVAVSASSITYSGYLSSGIGAEVSMAVSGQDVNRTFTAQTSGSIYASCLIHITSATTTGDYFFHLGASTISTTYHGRVFVKKDASNNLAFGISRAGAVATAIFTPFTYALNTTYLLVLKYTIVSGVTNDISAIYINPTLNAIEPVTGWTTSSDTPTDLANIGAVALRQGSASTAPALKIDGIRVATTWAEIVGAASSCTASTLAFETSSYSNTVGDATFTQTASSLNATTAIVYSSSNKAAADVDPATGAITIGAAGSATITATQAAGTHSAVDYCAATTSYNITVAEAPCSASNLAFSTTTYNKLVGDAAFTQAATSLNATTAITYESDNSAVATVNATTGEVAIVGTGTANIKATQALGVHNTVNYCASTASYAINVTTLAPTITVTEVTVPNFTANIGNESSKTLNVSGINLSTDITLALSGTNADQFTVSQPSVSQSSGTAANTSITVKYTPTTTGNHTATLTLSSTGATPITRSLSGTAGLNTPVATSASGQSLTSLTANWDAVAGATEYQLDVFTKTSASTLASDLFISEYVEGLSNNKAIEIYNGTGNSVDLSAYSIKKQTNGAGVYSTEQILSGTLANNDVYVYANTSANATILGVADSNNNTTMTFNGNDAVALFKSGEQIDEVGVFNQTTDWGKDLTLIRKSTVSAPKATFDLADWDSQVTDYVANLGSHTMAGSSSTISTIQGSPFTVTGANSKVLEGLSSSTTYYYTVIAKNGSVTTPVSNEIAASTTTTEITTATATLPISIVNGKIQLTTKAGETVSVYNTIGQKILSKITVEGLNSIAVSAHGMVIIKIGNKVAKVIL